MPDINLLDSSIYNLISAGEVVERPASVVKELVENAIDAGATKIGIQIKEGGIRQIVISDNGCGMDENNLKKACLPHATSKLKEASDLDCIATLGFRGEALASIAAVSQLEIKTKTEDEELGNKLSVQAGKMQDIEPCGANKGTSITVNNLFYNTPVRAKFLKKPKAEQALVTQTVSALILSNPEVAFNYVADGESIFNTIGGMEDAVYQIYGNDVANNMIFFDESFQGGYRVYGYTGNRELSRHNRNYQTIIINGRVIQNQQISVAVSQAYGASLMKRCYPVFVINIIMPFDEVDVNVHPSKSEVRFRDASKIFSVVYRAVTLALASQESSIHINNTQTDVHNFSEQAEQENADFIKSVPNGTQDKADLSETLSKESEKQDDMQVTASAQSDCNNSNCCSGASIIDSILRVASSDSYKKPSFAFEEKDKDEISSKDIQKAVSSQLTKTEEFANVHADLAKKPSKSVKDSAYGYVQSSIYDDGEVFDEINKTLQSGYEVIGQIFDTYLILQQDGVVYVIDQHAAHERFLYDGLIEKLDKKQCVSQPMIVPYVLDCDSTQYEFVTKCKQNLCDLGFEIEEFGGLSFKINAVPQILSDINLTVFFASLFEDRIKLGMLKSSDLITDTLAQRACKAAIKAGDKLSEEQIKCLLGQMKQGIPVQCPHGRPTTLKFTRKDLDKMFKRIV